MLLFIIQGVCVQNATPVNDGGETEPLINVVSPIILANKVDFPDATGPVIAVSPRRKMRFNWRKVGAVASADQDISASANEMSAVDGADGCCMLLISVDSLGTSKDTEDEGDRFSRSVDLRRYTSIISKQDTAWKKVGRAWQNVSSGFVKILIKERDVKAWAERSAWSFLAAAMPA